MDTIKVYAALDEKGRPVLRTVGPHKTTYRVYSSISSARRAKKRIEQLGPEAIRKLHFG